MKQITDLVNQPVVKALYKSLGEEADLHLVGGAIRDLLENKEPKDLDFATVLVPDQILSKLNVAKIKCIPTGIRRGTITAIIEGESVEITTFRNYEDENTFSLSIEEDLSARDFTINAIAYSLNKDTLIDPYNGILDLNKKIVKAVGDPYLRFTEDPHRILRFIRFSVGSGRGMDPTTWGAAVSLSTTLSRVSVERIRDEFIKIIQCDYFAAALTILVESDILQSSIPELKEGLDFEQNKYHTEDVFGHILDVMDGIDRQNLTLCLAALFHDIAKPRSLIINDKGERQFLGHEDLGSVMSKKIMERLKFPRELTDNVVQLVRLHMRPVNMGVKAVRRLIVDLGDDLFNHWLELKHADLFAPRGSTPFDIEQEWSDFLLTVQKAQEEKVKHKFHSLAIRGQDVLDLGVVPGPQVGSILNTINELVLDNPELNKKEVLINKVKGLLCL